MRFTRYDPVAAAESRERQLIRAAKTAARKAAKKTKKQAQKKTKKCSKPKRARTPSSLGGKSVYKTEQWKRLRYEVLCEQKSTCQLCGISPKDGAVMNVDHIYPLHSHPHLAFVKSNLRVLCASCNWGNGGRNPEQGEFDIPWDRFEKF